MRAKFSIFRSLMMGLLALSTVAFTNCQKDKDADALPSLVIVTEDNKDVTELTIAAPVEGLAYTFGVKTNISGGWNVSTTADWITISPKSGSGVGAVNVTITENTGADRTAAIALAAGNMKRNITVTQKGTSGVDAVFYEAFGSTAVEKNWSSSGPGTGTYWPYVDQCAAHNALTKEGTGAANVTYGGSGTSVRPSNPSSGYEGATGVNSCLFGNGKADAYVTMGNIALGTDKQFTLTFGVSHAAGATPNSYTNVTATDIKVLVSGNGTDFVEVTPTLPTAAAWGLASVAFGVPTDVSTLYLKFLVPMNATEYSVIRIDDVTLKVGGNGAVLDLKAGGASGEVDYPKTAVSTFAESFAGAENYKVYTSANWWFTSSDAGYPAAPELGWCARVYGTDLYLSCAPYKSTTAEVVAYAGMVPFNVKAATKKTLTFDKASYYKTFSADKLEVVASKDFAGKVAEATWTVVKDCSSVAPDTVSNKWYAQSVDLSQFAADEKVYVAFRYTGKNLTYRLDNISFNGGEVVEPTDTTTAALPFSYDGAKGKAGIEGLSGFAQYGLGDDYAASNAPYLLKFANDNTCVILHYRGAAGQVQVDTRATGDAVDNSFIFYGSVDGKDYTRFDSLVVSAGKNVAQTLTTGTVNSAYRYIKIAYRKHTSGTNAAVGSIVVSKAGTEIDVKPVVTTIVASDVTETSATLKGSYTYTGKGTVSAVGFVFNGGKVAATNNSGAFSYAATGLTAGTVYKYQAYVTIDGVDYHGAEMSVVTNSNVAPISVKELVALWVAKDTTKMHAATVQGYIAKVCTAATEGASAGTIYLIDNKADTTSGVVLYASALTSVVKAGDLVKIKMVNAKFSEFGGVRQYQGVTAADVTVVSSNNTLTPVKITAKELNASASRYQSMYIAIDNAKAASTAVGQKFSLAASDKTWVFNDGTADVNFFVKKNYTALLDATISGTAGTLKGIAAAHSGVAQLIPSSAEDLAPFIATNVPVITVNPTSVKDVAKTGATGSVTYSMTNVASGAVATVKAGADWVTVGTVTATAIPYTVAANTGAARATTITVSYTGAADVVIPVNQLGESVASIYSQDFSTISNSAKKAPTTGTEASSTEYSTAVADGTLAGWAGKIYAAEGCVKIGTSSDKVVTATVLSSLTAATDVKVTFKAYSWFAKTTTITPTASVGTVSPASIALPTGAAYGVAITNGIETTSYSFDITGATSATVITLTGSERFFLDDFVITKK